MLLSVFQMVRSYARKTDRAKYGNNSLQAALDAVKDGMSLKRASVQFGISRPVLRRHRDGKVRNPGESRLGNFVAVFSEELERKLVDKIKMMERSMYGLTTVDVRRIAYELAVKLNVKHGFNLESKMAGKEWLRSFMKRNKDLSIRAPEATNISRAVGFYRAQVAIFTNLLKECFQSSKYSAQSIWNVDESGITNVHKPCKIVATKGARQVSKITSGERGATVTVICAMSAAGQYVPPMMIWPRKRMADALMRGAPPGSIGAVSDNGWTDCSLFVKWLHHFISFDKCSVDSPSILIIDGHGSHKSLEAIDLARDHGVTMITLPPHTTHRLQPLDVTFFKSLKANYNAAADSFLMSNPGKRVTFFDMADLFGKAYCKSASIEKAVRGFEHTGIWPLDEAKFSDEQFAASVVTDEPLPQTSEVTGKAPATVADQEQSTSVLLVDLVQTSTEASASVSVQDPVATQTAGHIMDVAEISESAARFRSSPSS